MVSLGKLAVFPINKQVLRYCNYSFLHSGLVCGLYVLKYWLFKIKPKQKSYKQTCYSQFSLGLRVFILAITALNTVLYRLKGNYSNGSKVDPFWAICDLENKLFPELLGNRLKNTLEKLSLHATECNCHVAAGLLPPPPPLLRQSLSLLLTFTVIISK